MKVKYTSSKWFLENNDGTKKPTCLGKGFCCADRRCDALAWEERQCIEIDEKDYRKIEDICIEFELDKENINATIWQYGIDKSYDLPDDVGFEIVYECQEEIMGCKGCSCKKVAHLKVENKENPYPNISIEEGLNMIQNALDKSIKEKKPISKGERSVRIDLFSHCEKAILNAQYELEKVGASEGLTKAAMLLSEARQLVTDYLYGK